MKVQQRYSYLFGLNDDDYKTEEHTRNRMMNIFPNTKSEKIEFTDIKIL